MSKQWYSLTVTNPEQQVKVHDSKEELEQYVTENPSMSFILPAAIAYLVWRGVRKNKNGDTRKMKPKRLSVGA